MIPDLSGRTILIVEDEPLIALEIEHDFESAGATVATAASFLEATSLIEKDGLSAAILDHALGDGTSDDLCNRLSQRKIPFVIYSGFAGLNGHCGDALQVSKPALPYHLVHLVAKLLERNVSY